MKQDQLIGTAKPESQHSALQEQIAQLQGELDAVIGKVDAYEALLQSHLSHELIEEQELSVLYKAQKSEKKAKRLAQKKRGKNYVEPVGLRPQKPSTSASVMTAAESKEKKRLYREAMLHVHPDKFSMNDDKVELATELTTRLVQIYKQEDLATLVAYHAHLLNSFGLTEDVSPFWQHNDQTTSPDAYLLLEIAQLEKAIEAVKGRHSYHVLTTNKDPSNFIDELRAYYQDRILRLRRRTRVK
ncbi:MAG: hypothetical protein RIF33_22425 [Cyclobacteriaceae bacterium]